MKQWMGGLLATIIGGVVIYWLTVGPLFHPAGVGACATGLSKDDAYHSALAPNSSWDWNCNGQEEREWHACEDFPGERCKNQPLRKVDIDQLTKDDVVGFCTKDRAATGCEPEVAACGQSGKLYPCVYNPEDGRCHAGWFETATTMRCK